MAFLGYLMIPIMLLNFFGALVSGIWLGVLGEWKLVGWGVALMLTSHFFLGFVLMLGLLLGGPAAVLADKGKVLFALPFLILSQVYTYGVIAVWCLAVFFFFVGSADRDSFIPLVVWSYGVALSPIMFMAQRDQMSGGGDASAFTTFSAQVAYIVIGLIVIFGNATFGTLCIVFAVIMTIGMLFQSALAVALYRAEMRYRNY
tara:strand:- start:60081 stop:60686 length:606 start_codon:yes stop_codon:yes gene_type:complete